MKIPTTTDAEAMPGTARVAIGGETLWERKVTDDEYERGPSWGGER